MGANIGYIRVSSVDQNAGRQLEGYSLDKVFEDKASGKDVKRPQLVACLDYLREGDALFVHSIDRLARNLEDLQKLVRGLNEKGVAVRFIQENIAFEAGQENPMQTLMFQMLGAFAQFERALIRERQREGIALAKKEGRQIGRTPSHDAPTIKKIREEASNAGTNKTELAQRYGISRQTLYRYLSIAWGGTIDK